jgi:hypothetical protein
MLLFYCDYHANLRQVQGNLKRTMQASQLAIIEFRKIRGGYAIKK